MGMDTDRRNIFCSPYFLQRKTSVSVKYLTVKCHTDKMIPKLYYICFEPISRAKKKREATESRNRRRVANRGVNQQKGETEERRASREVNQLKGEAE